MSKSNEPLPLERRPVVDYSGPPARLKLTPVALVSHIGLCIVALALPIYIALSLMPVPQQVAWLQRAGAFIGVAAMSTLGVLCIGLIARKRWARDGMLAFAWFEMVWESIKLLLTVFFYAPVYRRLMTEELARQFAAATQPTTQPTAFASFTSYGIYIMAVLSWLIFFGYAFAARKAMNTPIARAALGRG